MQSVKILPQTILFKGNLAQPWKYCPTKYFGYTVCDWICENQSYRPWQKIWFSLWTEWWMNKLQWCVIFHFQSKLNFSALLCWLFICDTVVIHMSSLGSKWKLGWYGAGCEWLHSSEVLNKAVCCKFSFISASVKTWMVHNASLCPFLYKFNHHLVRLWPPPLFHVGNQHRVKYYLKWQTT